MKRSAPVILAVILMLSGLTASAELCTIDPVPSATLLLPYFEVDLDDPNGATTLFWVTNASATAALVHVVLWTDLSVPTLDFNVYLTGYDVQGFNLRDIFVNGVLPVTASDGQDPADTISPQGPFSQDINFASCNQQLPLPSPAMSALYINHIQAAHTGQFSPLFGRCSGQDLGDNIARGYVTMDTVSYCTLLFPGDPGYFNSGAATNQNILTGDYMYVDSANNFAQGDTLVHIEADPTAFVPGDYTFYGRYVAATAADFREPLGTVSAVRYMTGADWSTDFVVWRDSTVAQNPFTCGTVPAWYPLADTELVLFDEQEEPWIDTSTCTISPCETPVTLIPFPAEANRVQVGGPSLPTPFDFGWAYLNLNTTVVGGTPGLAPYAQSWVSAIYSSQGRFSSGVAATQFDSACDPIGNIIAP